MEAIVNYLIKATGWSIFHSLWQGAIIYALLLMCLSLFPKLNPRVRHNMAFGTLCLMFVCFCITFYTLFELPAKRVQASGQFIIEGTQVSSFASIPAQLRANAEYIFPYLCGAYIAGLLLQLLVLAVGYNKVLKLKKAARKAVPAEWQSVFEQIRHTLSLRRSVGFYLSEQVNVPLVIGYLKPIVLFPIALASQLDIKQVEAILIHELSHIRRNDYLLNLIRTGIETLLFFNPFVWLTTKFIGIEREHACDDMVVKFTGTPLTYAHALLKLEILKDKSVPALSIAATGNNQHLYQRIKRITDMKTNYMNAKQQFFAITLILATIVSLAWISPEKKPVARKQPAKTNVNRNVNTVIKESVVRTTVSSTVPHVDCVADTTKKKRVVKIITMDEKGNRKEYNSLKEMPDTIRNEVLFDDVLGKLENLDSILTIHGRAFGPEQAEKRKAIAIELQNSVAKAREHSKIAYNMAIENHAKAIEQAKHVTYSFHAVPKDVPNRIVRDTTITYSFNGIPKFDRKDLDALRELRESKEYLKAKKKFDDEVDKLKRKKGIKSKVHDSDGATTAIINIK